jgi:hypothetical protein
MNHWEKKRMKRWFVAAGGCWIWTGSINRKTGYGCVHARGERLAHRLFWVERNGPIPEELEVDHVCRNRACVNVDHMRLVTHKENMENGRNALVVACPNGHPYSGENLAMNGRGHRVCVTCRNAAQRRWYAAHREAAVAKMREKRAAWKASVRL